MIRDILYLKTDIGMGDKNPSFHDIAITEYKYSSTRMGMPSLTATLMYGSCLDDEWTGKEYVELRGERYYIRHTPTSLKNNNDERYSHELVFHSERDELLVNAYFIDAVKDYSLTKDKPCSNSTTFTFFGTIREFVDRLNCAFLEAGVGDSILREKTSLTTLDNPVGDGYCAMLDPYGDYDKDESHEYSFEDKTLWEAISEGYNINEIPFEFRGKRLIWGAVPQVVEQKFEYGHDNELLSVKKNNANAKVINRITMLGSSENLPYYYPNETEYGNIAIKTESANNSLLASNIKVLNRTQMLAYMTPGTHAVLCKYGIGDGKGGKISYSNLQCGIEDTAMQPYSFGQQLSYMVTEVHMGYAKWRIGMDIEVSDAGSYICDKLNGHIWYENVSSPSYNAANPLFSGVMGVRLTSKSDAVDLSDNTSCDESGIRLEIPKAGKYYLQITVRISVRDSRNRNIRSFFWLNNIGFNNLFGEGKNGYFWDVDGKTYDGERALGVEIDGLNDQMVGSSFWWDGEYRLPFQTRLMPSIYRQTKGDERFYNALNDTYINPDTGKPYVFPNPFVDGAPNEYIYSNEKIKPSLAGIKNKKGELMGVIADVAYDNDDNDALVVDAKEEDDKNDSLKYQHSYFYIKLNIFNGEYGFNLFEHALQSDAMTIQMTDGNCNGCKFKIQAVEFTDPSGLKSYKNPVQINPSTGAIVNGSYKDKVKKDNFQEQQQDTSLYSVWICVQKDADTFGVIMPNQTNKFMPHVGDSFNIINIDLPQVYINAAEKRLEEDGLRYMSENNEEKFTFDISASRIFFANNPEILNEIDEYSKIVVIYNNKEYELFISSFGIECKNGEALPDISIELTDTISVGESFAQTVAAQAASLISNPTVTGGNTGTTGLSTGLADRRYLNKQKADRSPYKIASDSGFEVGDFVSGSSGGLFFRDPETGYTWIEADMLKIRMKAIFDELVIAETNSIGGKQIITPGGSIKISFVDTIKDAEGNVTGYRCYFKSKEENEGADCRFVVGDQVYSEQFNISNGTHSNATNNYYWRLITAVSNDDSYVDLSVTDCAKGSMIPLAGDVLCQLGNRNDATRQSAIILSTVDAFAPSVILYNGIDNYSLESKSVVEYGVDKTKNPPEPFFNCYGRMFVGPRTKESYIEFMPADKRLIFKGELDIKSTVGGQDLLEFIKDNAGVSEDIKKFVDAALKEIQDQIDGVIETWFSNGEPTLENHPASEWNTEDLKIQHLGDLYYDNNTGTAYRFSTKDDGTYFWNVITDDAITKALAAAKDAQDTADLKRRIFTSEPTTPYDEGDLWVNATYSPDYSNDILRCLKGKSTGTFDIKDWGLASRYTDDSALNNFIAQYDEQMKSYKEQLDGKVETWFFDYEPTTLNVPAKDWDAQEKKDHAGDLFFDTSKGYAYRWTGSSWIRIKDKDITDALDAAASAQDIANNKRRVFTSQPTPPYNEGDLWVSGGEDGNTLMVAVKDKENGAFSENDWVVADNAGLEAFSKTVTESLNGIQDQIDSKAETWYQSSDPSSNWKTDDDKKNHKGDLWYNTDNGTTWYWNGTQWQQQDVPAAVFDAIDGKSSIFVSKPEDGYLINDLWFLEQEYELSDGKWSKGTLVVAIADMNDKWNKNDWAKKDRYTDDTLAQEAVDRFVAWAADGVFSPTEQKELELELERIAGDKDSLDKKYAIFYDSANPDANLVAAKTAYTNAYNAYVNVINGVLAANPDNDGCVTIPANFKALMQDYYTKRAQYDYMLMLAAKKYSDSSVAGFAYLKEALKQDTKIEGGLIMSTLISLGVTDPDTQKRITRAGINGAIDPKLGEKSIAAWFGGEMIDREAEGAVLDNAAATLFRMDGSSYFCKGNVSLKADGSGFVAGGALSWNANGTPILASGITIEGTDKTIQSIINTINAWADVFVVVEKTNSGYVTHDFAWAIQNPTKVFAIKSNYNFYSDGFISALGADDSTGSGGGGIDVAFLENYLKDYAKKSDIPSLTAYLTKTSAASTYLTKTDAASLYQPKGDYLVKHQTIYALTFAAGTFSTKTYTPNNGAQTVNIPTNTSHIAESGNLYFTDARAVAALKTVTDGLASDITSLNSSLTAKIDSVNTTLTAKINDVSTKLTTKINSVEKKVDDFKAEFDKIFTPEWSADGKLISIKANAGLWTDQYLTALGKNADGTTSGGGLDMEALNNVLKDYAKKSEIPSLTGYATQSWVNAQGFLKSVSWSAVSGKPAWIGASKPSYQFSEIGSTPTTLSGYGITDAKIVNGVITLGGNTITPVTDISGKVDKEAGKGLSSNDFTDTLLTKLNGIEAGANKYIHPTNGANTTIAAANGKVISSITVNNLGHVTAVVSKTLASADIPALAISKITGLQAALDSKLDKSTFNSVFEIEKDKQGNITAIKAKYGFYSIGFVSALGQNPDGTTSGGGIDVEFLQNYLDGKNNNHPYKYATESWVNGLFHTLTIQKNGTTVGTFNPKTANATINLTDVASASTLSSHTSNKTAHITEDERTKWNKVVTDFAAITGTDTDNIINKWEEVVAFLDTYTEADTLANLLSNKADKTQLADYVEKEGDTMTGALHVSIDKAVTHIGLDRASYNYIRATKSGGMIAFVANGLAEGNSGNADLIVSDGSVFPGTTNVTALGKTALRFSNVYSVLGNFSGRITSTVATGNSPFVIASTTVNTNLNADLLDGFHASNFVKIKGESLSQHNQGSWMKFMTFEINAGSALKPTLSFTWHPSECNRNVWMDLNISIRKSMNSDGTAIASCDIIFMKDVKGTVDRSFICVGNGTAFSVWVKCDKANYDGYGYVVVNHYAELKSAPSVSKHSYSDTEPTGTYKNAATLSSISYSATKLQTSRTLWGRPFDGTAPVTGSLSSVTDITMSGKLKIGGATIVWDGKMLHFDKGIYSDGAISALGLNGEASGNGGYNRYDGNWSDYSASLNDSVVSVKSGYELLKRIQSLEGGSALNVVESGSGNGVSSVKKNGTTITVTKTTFLTSHQSLEDYLKIDGSNGTAAGLTAMINKLNTGDSNVTDNTLFVTSHASTPAGNNYYRRSATFLWGYIKTKANAVYQPIGSYVTTNTAQTISAKKTFTSDIVMGTSHYIYGAEESRGAMLQFDGTRTIIGSVGASSTAATHLRSKTGHLTVGTSSNASFTVWDSGNDGSGSGLDADLLDGTHKSGLLTAFNRLGDHNNKLNVTVGGTTKDVSLYPLSSWGLRYVNKDDNGGKPVLVLIADVSAWKGSSKDAAHHGFIGRIVESRTGGYIGEKITDVICRVGYQDANGTNTIHMRTSNPSYVRPKIVSYNSKTYIGFLLYNSGHSCMMEGMFHGCLSTFIQLACTDSNGTMPSGVTDLTGSYTVYNYVAFNAKLETRKLWGNDFDGTRNVGGTMTFNADGDQRQLSISVTGGIKLKAGTGSWAWGMSSIKRADGASLGYSAGAYGQADTLKYHYYGGSYNSPSAVILPTGNMGIGLTNPAYKLEVNGTAKVTKLIIGGATIEWDSSKSGLKVSHGIYSQTYISALGIGNATSGGGLGYNRYGDWAKTPGDTDVLGANLGVDLNNRVENLESGSALKFTTTGTGNAVTSINKNGTSVTITKGSTFLTAHQSLADYYTKTDANSKFLTAVAVGTGDNASKIGVTKNGTTTYLTVPYATKANLLQNNSAMSYSASGLQWFNISGTAGCVAKANDTPTSAWWHVLRFNHANNAGYYTDLAVPFNADSLYWKTVRNGKLAHDKWVKVLDELNYNDVMWQMIADSTDLNTNKTNGLLYVKTDANAGTLKNSPFTNSFAMISKQCYADGTDIRRARIAFSAYGAMKVFNDRVTAGDGGTWYDVVTSGNYTDIVKKIGTANVGSGVKPIYLNAGTPTASASTVGGTAKPVYLNAGTITALSATVGSTTKPVYMNAGTLTALSATAGASNRPVYLNGGELTAVSSVAVGYIGAGGPSKSNFLGVTDVVDGVTANNRFEAIPANLLTVELWNGSAWEAWTGSDIEKQKLFSLAGGSVSAKVNNGTTGNKIRLTVTAANGKIYFHITRLMMNISVNGLSSVKALVEGAKIGSETTYETIGTYGVGGWSGWNTVYLDHTLGGAESQTTQFRKLRITFSGTLTTSEHKTKFFQVFNVLAYGTTCWSNTGVVNKWNRPYTYALDTFAATFEGDIKTKSNAAYSLGSSAAIWQNVYTKYVKSNTTLYLDSGASCSTIVSINGVEKARFAQPNGYLGLGITAPTQRIDALGNMRLQSSASGAGGDVHMELWRGTNASWRILNTSGNLKFQSNYTSAAGSYFDVLQLDYNTGKAWFKNEVIGKSANAFRCSYGTYGAILRTDSSRFWILLTDKDAAASGTFNTLRPFSIHFDTGQVTLGHTLYVGGLASLAGGAVIPTEKSLKIGDATISWNADKKMLHINKGVYSDGAVSALGMGASGTSAGVSYNRYDGDWNNYTSAFDTYVVSGKSGNELLKRIKSLEEGSALSVTTTGSGNAVTAVSKSGTAITVTKGSTFLTTSAASSTYQPKGSYVTLDTAQTIKGVKTFDANVILAATRMINIVSETATITKTSTQAIHGGKDGANENDANLRFGSWFGIGWYPTISGQNVEQGKNAMWLNVRTGVLTVAGKFVKKDGEATDFLMADGSLRVVKNNTTKNSLGWTNVTDEAANIPTMNTLAYWNGAYAGVSSNLTYCNKGAFGTMATKNAADYLALAGGTMANTNLVTNMNADLVDGYHAYGTTGKALKKSGYVTSSTKGLSSYWGKLATINVGANVEEHDITIYLHSCYNGIYGTLSLRLRTATDSPAFQARLLSGNIPKDRIRVYYNSTTPNVFEVWVNVNAQWGVINAILLSETGRANNENVTPTVTFHETSFTTVQTASLSAYITPSYIGLLNNAATATSASQLTTSRNLWGRPFNGTANVTGNLTSVGNITGSGAMTISSTNGRLTLNGAATALDLKFAGDNTKSVILNGSAFKPYDDANNKLTLGSTTARWSTLYATAGDFAGLIRGRSAFAVSPYNNYDADTAGDTKTASGVSVKFVSTMPIVSILGSNTSPMINIGSYVNNKLYGAVITAGGNDTSSFLKITTAVLDIATGVITTSHSTGTQLKGNQGGALINSTNTAGTFTMLAKLNTTNGYIMHGVSGSTYNFYYTPKSSVDNGTVTNIKTLLSMTEGGFIAIGSGLSVGDSMSVHGGLELSMATPFIDFHYGKSTADYTTRLIEEASGKLKVIGTFHVTTGIYSDTYVTAKTASTSSDARLKDIAGRLSLGVKTIADAPSVFFSWKDDGKRHRHAGTIAQYWKRTLPEVVHTNADGFMSVEYGVLGVMMGISLARTVDVHERRIDRLERENNELRRRVAELEKCID